MRHILQYIRLVDFEIQSFMKTTGRILYILSLILLSSWGVSAADVEDETMSTWAEIERYIAQGSWEEADSAIVSILGQRTDDATDAMLLSNLGMIRHYAGNDSLAIETLTQANAAAPASVTILANRAKVYTAMGRIVEAVGDYNRIELLDPSYADTYLFRGLLYLYNGFFEDALADLRHLETLRPDKEETLIALASLYTITDDYENANSYYTRLLSAAPCAEYFAGRAMCALQLDRLVDASEDIADGLQLDPDYSELYLCRAILNKKRYLTADAHTDADRAIALGANPVRVKALLGF